VSQHKRDLDLVYEPDQEWAHFVLYTEPGSGIVSSAFNDMLRVDGDSPYAREWRDRLQQVEPNPLHTLLLPDKRKMPALFHPCVYEDENSPSAVGKSGCVCFQSWYDPEFGMPVVADHYRTVGGRIENWTHRTYAPLDLRRDDVFDSLIIDGGRNFWIRTTDGLLSFLPQHRMHPYNIGYGGGGPGELARYIQKLIDTNGEDTSANTGFGGREVHPGILAWVSSEDSTHSRELTLDDLRALRHA